MTFYPGLFGRYYGIEVAHEDVSEDRYSEAPCTVGVLTSVVFSPSTPHQPGLVQLGFAHSRTHRTHTFLRSFLLATARMPEEFPPLPVSHRDIGYDLRGSSFAWGRPSSNGIDVYASQRCENWDDPLGRDQLNVIMRIAIGEAVMDLGGFDRETTPYLAVTSLSLSGSQPPTFRLLPDQHVARAIPLLEAT